MFGTLLFLFSTALFSWLAFGAFFQLTGAVAGLFYKNKTVATVAFFPKMRVFIPAFREDSVIISTVRAVKKADFPAEKLEIVVIADQLKNATIEQLKMLGARVIEVHFAKSTKAKSLNFALEVLKNEPADIAVVLDADNAPATGFFEKIAARWVAGSQAIQGRRAAKNLDSPLALLDAASEDANNHILCRGARAMGFSARLAGSGMAFDHAVFAAVMPKIEAVGGFDKALEGHLTRLGILIEYDEKAVVFDEKVSKSAHFSRQRSRWMAAQFRFFGHFLPSALVELVHRRNFDFFQKTIQMALPPRLIAPGILTLGTAVGWFFESPMAPFWAVALVANVLAFALALPRYFFEKKAVGAWLHLPKTFFAALAALPQIPQASRVFLVTPKTVSA